MIYAFIETEKANHRVSAMCRALKVSKSGFYGWRDRLPSARARADTMLSEKIVRIHTDSRETYGAPRIHFELRTLGVRCARKRVARLMREAGLCADAVLAGGRPVPPYAHRPSVLPGSGSGEAQLHPRGPGPPVGRGHHLRKNLGGLTLPRLRARHLLSQGRRLVHGEQP